MRIGLENYPQIQVINSTSQSTVKYCIVDVRGNHGLFASFYCLTYGIYICLMEELTPIIQLNGEEHLYYQKEYGENIFEYYYNPVPRKKVKETENIPIIKVINPSIFLKWCRVSLVEKQMSNLIIMQYFQLQKELRSTIDKFANTHFKNLRVLGVHYRGRDKVNESPILPFSDYEKVIDNLMEKRICDAIFFCSDEFEYRGYLKQKYNERVIVYDLEGNYEAHKSSESRKTMGLHFESPTPYLQGKDSLMECYLLAKCDMLLSSSNSSFSLFATFLNPYIAHIILNN